MWFMEVVDGTGRTGVHRGLCFILTRGTPRNWSTRDQFCPQIPLPLDVNTSICNFGRDVSRRVNPWLTSVATCNRKDLPFIFADIEQCAIRCLCHHGCEAPHIVSRRRRKKNLLLHICSCWFQSWVLASRYRFPPKRNYFICSDNECRQLVLWSSSQIPTWCKYNTTTTVTITIITTNSNSNNNNWEKLASSSPFKENRWNYWVSYSSTDLSTQKGPKGYVLDIFPLSITNKNY